MCGEALPQGGGPGVDIDGRLAPPGPRFSAQPPTSSFILVGQPRQMFRYGLTMVTRIIHERERERDKKRVPHESIARGYIKVVSPQLYSA